MAIKPRHAGAGAILLLMLTAFGAHAAQDILKPEQAFRYSATADGDDVVVVWDIEPGHYLYKERMSFASANDEVVLGDAHMPVGKPYEDEFFGKMHIYRDAAEIRIPVVARPMNLRSFELELRSQGCADIGLCYPPQVWTASIDMGGSAPAGRMEQLLNRNPATAGADDPLPPDQAFQVDVTTADPFTVSVSWTIADGYYLYRDSLQINSAGEAAQIGAITIPQGTLKWDEHFGETQVFFDEVSAEVALQRASPDGGTLPLDIQYQGCKENSICYPIQNVSLVADLPTATVSNLRAGNDDTGAPISEQDSLARLIVNGNILAVMLVFLGLGLGLAFTPCVLPMVPILSGIITGQGETVTTRRAFLLSLTYVMGMALTYTAAGAAFALAGGQIQAALQKPWIIIGVAGLFVALACSMFGMFELQMPAAVQTRLASISNRQRSGTYLGTAIMGVLSALIVTTCVAPPLVASATVIAQTGDVVRGALSLFAMSIGMGIPLLVIGTSAGRLLPRAGAWMNAVKGAFGFMMLGLAVWMLDRILPDLATMLLWAVLIFMAGIFLGAFQPLDAASRATTKLAKGFGMLAALYGAALLLGALGGADNPLQPLRFAATSQDMHEGVEFKRIKTIEDLEYEIQLATTAGRPVMLDFYADWCVSCIEMENYTFTNDQVREKLASAVLLQADVTANDDEDQALLQHFGIFGPPTIMFFDASGNEHRAYRVVGYMPADEFATHVDRAFQST